MDVLVWLMFLVFLLMLSGYASKAEVIRLSRRIKKLENNKKGVKSEMSKLVSEMKGKRCKIVLQAQVGASVQISNIPIVTIIDIDDEWVKVQSEDKKSNTQIELLRIDEIFSITEVN